MKADPDDYRIAAVLCNTNFERVSELMMQLGLQEHAALIRGVDKGQLIARVVTRGCDSGEFFPGELFVLLLVCLREAGIKGASPELRRVVREALLRAHAEQATRDLLRGVREGMSKP